MDPNRQQNQNNQNSRIQIPRNMQEEEKGEPNRPQQNQQQFQQPSNPNKISIAIAFSGNSYQTQLPGQQLDGEDDDGGEFNEDDDDDYDDEEENENENYDNDDDYQQETGQGTNQENLGYQQNQNQFQDSLMHQQYNHQNQQYHHIQGEYSHNFHGQSQQSAPYQQQNYSGEVQQNYQDEQQNDLISLVVGNNNKTQQNENTDQHYQEDDDFFYNQQIQIPQQEYQQPSYLQQEQVLANPIEHLNKKTQQEVEKPQLVSIKIHQTNQDQNKIPTYSSIAQTPQNNPDIFFSQPNQQIQQQQQQNTVASSDSKIKLNFANLSLQAQAPNWEDDENDQSQDDQDSLMRDQSYNQLSEVIGQQDPSQNEIQQYQELPHSLSQQFTSSVAQSQQQQQQQHFASPIQIPQTAYQQQPTFHSEKEYIQHQEPIQVSQQTIQQPIQINLATLQQQLHMNPPTSQMCEPEIPIPEKKSKKKRKKKYTGDLLDIYQLEKIKFIMEFDPNINGARFQSEYNFTLREQELVEMFIGQMKTQKYKKCYLDLSLHSKYVQILEVFLMKKGNKNSDQQQAQKIIKKFSYPNPDDQIKYQEVNYDKVSKDLHSYEVKQRETFDNNMKTPLLNISKVAEIKMKSDDVMQQIEKKIKVIVTYVIGNFTDFGIKKVSYKIAQGAQELSQEQQIGSYYYTQDIFDQTQLWLPVVNGAQQIPINWTLKFLAPPQYHFISSGVLTQKQTEAQGLKRTLYVYKLREKDMATQEKIGFIFGQFPHIHKLQDLSKVCPNGFYTFFNNERKLDIFKYNQFYEKNIESICYYLKKLINQDYPSSSNKIVFVPNLFSSKSRKQSIDFSGGLHIMDEEILFQKNVLENRYKTYKYLTSCLAYDYFGGKTIEHSPEDYWLLLGLRESLGNHYKISKCGILLYRYHIMQTIESLYKKMKNGIERYPLQSNNNQPHPADQQFNEIVYEKCELIMHMIESMIDKSYYEKIIRQLYQSASPTISSGLFLNIYKDVCGLKLKSFYNNWIQSTSCPKLTASFQYNKKNNSLDLTIMQQSAMRDYFAYRKYIKNCVDLDKLFTNPFQGPEFKAMLKKTDPIDTFFVELKRECMRWFTGDVNVMLYLTDGAEIHTQQQKMSLKFGKTTVQVNIPLQTKVKKTIQNKKKEFESMMVDNEMGDDEKDEDQDDGGSGQQHIVDNSSWKFGLNDFELEDYPYETKNLFEVKNLESPVLWIRVDPDMEFIRRVKVKQDQNNWLFQLLQEKDIIGQIEAIRQLKKFNSEHVYEILKSVSVNENYFFKVRKEALKSLQKMQTSQFNKYLSHEKFLIKIFNQRNFDQKIGFYKSNDFSKILEYYIDKYILKTLAKCKEQPLKIKEEIKEQFQVKDTSQNISLTVFDNDVVQLNKAQPKIDEDLINISSEQIAQLLLKLLDENDNSENPFDDSFYVKQILISLGKLDNFKYMPQIASEIYRQFRLDHIGRFSPHFAITKGALLGYFSLRKQIFNFNDKKRHNIDLLQEDILWYDEQIRQTEVVLDKMKDEIESLLKDLKWPFEVRRLVLEQQTKHAFFYQKYSFMKALYIVLKQVDVWQQQQDYKMANECLKITVLFIEKEWQKLEYRELFLKNERNKTIINILWKNLQIPFSFIDQEFTFWVKRLYHQFYSNEVPIGIQEIQKNLSDIFVYPIQYDEVWTKGEENQNLSNVNDERDKNLSRILQAKSAQVIVRTPKQDTIEQINTSTMGNDGKLRIVLPGGIQQQQLQQQTQFNRRLEQQFQQQPFDSSVKLSVSGFSWDKQFGQQQTQLLPLLQMPPEDDNESVYDEFAEIKFDIDWMQKAWDVLGLLWYHEESAAFLYPINEDILGEFYEDYMRQIKFPMDFTTIKQKFIDKAYRSVDDFKYDVSLVFSNCKQYNHESSDIHMAAVKLDRFFWEQLAERNLINPSNAFVRVR